jgi:hypothetical protein
MPDLQRFYGASSEVVNYGRALASRGGSDIGSLNAMRITQCLETLYSALGGRAAARSVMVDAMFFMPGSNLASGASFLTLRGRVGTLVNGPTYNTLGLSLNASGTTQNQYATVVLPDTRTGSVCFFGHGGGWTGIDTSTPALFFIGNSVGVNIATALGAQNTAGHSGGGALQGYTQQGASVNGTTASISTGTARGFYPADAQVRSVVLTNDNAASPTMNVYVDGFLTNTKNAGLFQATSTCTILDIGAYNQNSTRVQFGTTTCVALFVFNRVLTATEVAQVDRAMQWLMPETKVMVADGDSDVYMNPGGTGSNPTPQTEWPYVVYSAKAGQYRLVNASWNGLVVADAATRYTNMVRQFRPGGKWASGVYLISTGINDLLAATSAATIWTGLQAALLLARGDGFRTVCLTLPIQTGYTSAQNAQRGALNGLIRAGAGSSYDVLVDADKIINSTAYAFDTLHLTEAGYALIANAVAGVI